MAGIIARSLCQPEIQTMTGPTVRRYRPEDAEAVRAICCDTAFYGKPIETVFKDRDLIADSLISYYAMFEADSFFVAESEGSVVGYLTGCADTERFNRLYRQAVVPRLFGKFLVRGHWLRWSVWRLLATLLPAARQLQRARQSLYGGYPAHCHLNLAMQVRRSGTGTKLLQAFQAHLIDREIRGVHASGATDQGKAFFAKAGFEILATCPLPRMSVPTPSQAWVMGKRLE
jgi:N-acetylglutamate synthase-like GNAT family acetyltransferase